MATGKKFTYRVVEKRNGWAAEIIRQVSARRTTISKRDTGFETEQAAIEWAEKTLGEFAQQQVERNKRKAEQRHERDVAKAEKQAANEAKRPVVEDDDEDFMDFDD
ncbi:DUF3622 domain-containing protein [Thaumasiovibrio subtropicus]|uniref:DUF3622 domain-containing protein n=1 Tax=Thaumasiovibrio subtropicus TaxID=1891207 RepID=UPI000B34DEBC|nr:DUF3622 domain-containing protein [Thaumasiovibrio subtropicus]